MTRTHLQNLEELETLVLKPGETLVVRSRRPLTPGEMHRVQGHLQDWLPGVPVIVLNSDLEIKAVELARAEL